MRRCAETRRQESAAAGKAGLAQTHQRPEAFGNHLIQAGATWSGMVPSTLADGGLGALLPAGPPLPSHGTEPGLACATSSRLHGRERFHDDVPACVDFQHLVDQVGQEVEVVNDQRKQPKLLVAVDVRHDHDQAVMQLFGGMKHPEINAVVRHQDV